jgi:DNA-binding transcriptional regulator YhcF (GntR family)
MKLISIQDHIGIPKYKQIIASIEDSVTNGLLKKNDRLPSINKVCMGFSLSRDTVMLAYEELKKRGIVYAIPGKGYYIRSLEVAIKEKIFLLFDELNIFKEDIYTAFLESIGNDVQVDIFFHHFNTGMFTKLINESNGNYTKYIIMPTNLPGAVSAIKTLPANEVFILDQTNPQLSAYPAVYQDFVKDIYDAFVKGKPLLDKYAKMILIFPGFREPLGMKEGFENFCRDFVFDNEIIHQFGDREIRHGEVYVIPNDRDLVKVIERSKQQGMKLGSDFGIISYNETPLKKIVENGITTISTDFIAMGKLLADMVMNGKKKQVENECRLIIRNSL